MRKHLQRWLMKRRHPQPRDTTLLCHICGQGKPAERTKRLYLHRPFTTQPPFVQVCHPCWEALP